MIAPSGIDTVARAIARGFGLGLLPVAPGTWAALATLPLAWAAHELGGFPGVAGVTLLLAVLGLWAVHRSADEARADAPEIVVDEIAGQLLALWPVSAALTATDAHALALWPGWLAAFVLFRLFDILKPWPVSLADRRSGARWVMLDDLIAGLLAACATMLAAVLFHGL